MSNVEYLLFDWGDTLMVDYPQYKGPMAFWEKVSPMPEVAETMPLLSTRYKCIVASNAGDSDALLMKQAFERIAMEKHFFGFVTSKELGASKPSPDFFTGIVKQYNLPLDRTVMIGNDYEKDVTGAKNIGLKTIFITQQQGDFSNADYKVSSFGKLLDIL